jgi:surfeit locus 1 family protein
VSAVRRLLWPALATLVALAILIALGFWQLARMVEKEAQLESLRLSMTTAPIPLADGDLRRLSVRRAGFPSRDYEQVAELARVKIEGRFLAARSVPVRATLPSGKGAAVSGIGFFWMTPLETPSGQIVFVNRGFVPSGGDWRSPAITTPDGAQEITGLMRAPEEPRMFMPADNPVKGEYFSRDPRSMARAAGLDPAKVASFFIDAERQPGSLTLPVGVDAREMIARIPNNHLQYAMTWFGLALTLVGVFAFFARARLKENA